MMPKPPPPLTDLNRLVDHKPAGNGVAISQIPVITAWAGCHRGPASWSWNGLEAKRIIMQTGHIRMSGEGGGFFLVT